MIEDTICAINDDNHDFCYCGNHEIFALGECKQCWEEKEAIEKDESRNLQQHAIDNFYAE